MKKTDKRSKIKAQHQPWRTDGKLLVFRRRDGSEPRCRREDANTFRVRTAGGKGWDSQMCTQTTVRPGTSEG